MRKTIVLLALAAALGACLGRARKSEPLAGPTVLDRAAEERGQLVFMGQCNQCHPGGAGGLGPPLNDLRLPRKVIELKVRAGHPLMPAFSEKEISGSELDDLVEYLMAMRSKDDGRG